MQRAAAADRLVAPLVVFVFAYVATFIVVVLARFPTGQWAPLASVTVATAVSVLLFERGRWDIGLFVPAPLAAREFAVGSLAGFALVGLGVVLVDVSTPLYHAAGNGFPWSELVVVFVPAVLHEELLFRGYAFQKLLRWNAAVAVVLGALFFAALHLGNPGLTRVGLLNIFMGGLLLALAYERYGRLWFPIGIHLAWNLMSGPISGHEVSGYVSSATLLVTRGSGHELLTGGDFGIEGSVWLTVIESAAVAILWRSNRMRRRNV